MCTTALVGAGCSDDDDDGGAAQDTTSSSAPVGTPTSGASTTQTTAGEQGAAVEDGEHVGFVTGIDVEARTLTVDVVQFLTGQDAVDAYHEDFPDDPEGPPNDFYVVDDESPFVTLPVADDVDVQLVRLQEDSDAGLSAGTFEELPDYFLGYVTEESERMSYLMFRLEVEDGAIVAITEQFTP